MTEVQSGSLRDISLVEIFFHFKITSRKSHVNLSVKFQLDKANFLNKTQVNIKTPISKQTECNRPLAGKSANIFQKVIIRPTKSII